MKHVITLFFLVMTLSVTAQSLQGSYRMTTQLSEGQVLTSKTNVDVRTYSLGLETTYFEVVQSQRIIIELELEVIPQENNNIWVFADLSNKYTYVEYNLSSNTWVVFNKEIWIEICPN